MKNMQKVISGPDDGRGIGGIGHMGMNEVGKLGIGNGFIG